MRRHAITSRPGNYTRYAVSLILLIAIIGGIAYIAQQLPQWRPDPKKDLPQPQISGKSLLGFARFVAQWSNKPFVPPKEDATPKEFFPFKDFEQGKSGHYDFLFKNMTDPA